MSRKQKSASEILSEMTAIIVGHLEKMSPDERKHRVAEFAETIGGKRERVRPKAAKVSRSRAKSRRIPA